MTPRTIFSLALKILGIFFIRNILEAFSRLLSVLVYFPQYPTGEEAFFNLGVTIPPLVLYSLFSWALLFRTAALVDLFRLDRNIGTGDAGIRIHRSVVLSIAVIMAGGWVVVNELPEFFRHLVYYFQERKLYVRMARPDVSYLVMSFVKVVIGLLLIVFNKIIVRIIEVRRKDNVPWHWPVKKPAKKGNRKILQK